MYKSNRRRYQCANNVIIAETIAERFYWKNSLYFFTAITSLGSHKCQTLFSRRESRKSSYYNNLRRVNHTFLLTQQRSKTHQYRIIIANAKHSSPSVHTCVRRCMYVRKTVKRKGTREKPGTHGRSGELFTSSRDVKAREKNRLAYLFD